MPLHPAILHAGLHKGEEILHYNDVALHPLHFGDLDNTPGAVHQPLQVDDDIEGRSQLRPHGVQGQLHPRHQRHGLDAVQGIAGAVRVRRGQRAIVAGVHRLQHIQRLAAAHLAHHNPIRAHPQRVDDQLPDAHFAAPLHVGRTRLQPHHMPLMQLQLRRVLDGDDAFALWQKA